MSMPACAFIRSIRAQAGRVGLPVDTGNAAQCPSNLPRYSAVQSSLPFCSTAHLKRAQLGDEASQCLSRQSWHIVSLASHNRLSKSDAVSAWRDYTELGKLSADGR